MRKILHTAFALALLFFSVKSNAQITLGTVDPGPYTPGSTIAATFTIGISSCIQIGNKFELYLSDASGNFSSPTLLGSYNSFYSAFVNGTIPSGIPAGTGYRVRIQSTTPALTSAVSAPFEIKLGTVVKAAINSTANYIIGTDPRTFGSCNSTNNTTYRFSNESSTANVTATINNELNPGPSTTLTYTTTGDATTKSFDAGLAHYTIFVKAVMPDGTVGTQAYFLINNLAVTNFTTTSGNTVCYPTGTFEYVVDVNATNGIKVNFPGNTYNINWGDGKANIYTICDIRANDSKIQHTYTESSCGLTFVSGATTTYNAFGINVGVAGPFCNGIIGTPISTTAIVVGRPINNFISPPVSCAGDIVVFDNQSSPGQRPNANGPGCSDNDVVYTWYVDDIEVAADKPLTFNLEYLFPTVGIHHIRLSSRSNGACQADVIEKTICVQAPPQPAFTLPSGTICLSAPTLTPTNTSVIDNSCTQTTVTYTWAVIPSAGVTFDPASPTPTFTFSQTGVYKITLNVATGTCNRTTEPQEVVVNAAPQTTMSPNISLCATGAFTFGPTGTVTKTTTTGTAKDLPNTYTWTVTGSGAYNFVLPDGPNSKYPVINFSDFATYTVTLVHQNGCGTETKSQVITFSPSPVPSIVANPNPICYNSLVNLQGAIANSTASTTFEWKSTGTGTFADPSSLTTTYTPSAAERDAGTTNITLLVTTGLTGNCATVSANIIVAINPNNTITSAPDKTICTENAVAYVPTSSVAGSTFSWTAVNTDGNASGFTASGSGNINDIITNNNATGNTVVIYTITPAANGCPGVPFTFTVTVTPKPAITATAAQPTICSGSLTAITLASNIGGTSYTWTSAATAGITGNTNRTVASADAAINDPLVNTTTAQGSVTYTITPISANGCPGTAQTITIFVDPAVTPANAGADESICDVNNYKLDGNLPTVGTGVWTLISGQTGIAFGSATDEKTTITGLVAGQAYTFRWTISSPGACAASTDDVVITVNTPTIAGVTSGEAIVCFENNTGVITLSGNTGTIEGWELSIDNGVSWQPVAVPNTTTTLTYTNLTQSTAYRAIVKNGGCDIKYSTSTLITVTPATTMATAGADQTLCNELSTMLDGNTPSTATGETGRWTLVSGNPNAEITDPTLRNTTVTKLTAGVTYVFRWTITGTSACGPTMDEVTINNQSPLTNTISSTDAEVCNGKVVTLNGSEPTGGAGAGTYTYTWESSTDGTTFTAISGETGKDLSITLTSTLTFRRTVSSGACTMASNVIRIIAQPPLANNTIAADQEICTGIIPAGLTGSTPTGSDGNYNYQWQSSADGTTWADINAAVLPNYAPPALTATTFYRRLVSTITCDGALRNISATVKITVKENAKAEYTFTTDKGCIPFVLDAQNIQVVLYPDRNATYTWYADDVVIGTSSSFPGYTITESNRSVTIKLVTTSSLGCTSATYSHAFSTEQNVSPSFTQSTTSGCGPLVVNFVNTSTSLTTGTFTWDFGNGQTSAQTMPSAVTFLPEATGKDTTYTITLTSITSCGTNSITSTVFVKAKPIAVFSPSRTTGCSPMRVTFSNTSPGSTNKYYYDFGDGTLLTANDRSDVEHTYITNVVRDYVVTMIAENDCGRDQKSYTIRVSPNTVLPELVVNANEKEGCAPFSVNFYNNSKGANVFVYDFGDGARLTTRSAPETVTHTFTTSGTFTVTLTASNGCSDTTTTETITVFAQPVVAFNADLKLGCAGLAVKFTNTSTDALTYVWDFGDGTTSAEFEPLHTYTDAQEFYTVTLTATNSLGCTQTTTMTNFIHVVRPPVAAFHVAPSNVISIPTYNFRFEDESSNNPAIWAWDFGDGTTSSLQNPSHSYLDTGTYVVTLRVTNTQGCSSSTFQNVTITGVPGYLYIANSFIPGSDYQELRDLKAKGSGIKSWKMSIFNKWGQALWETTKLEDGSPAEGWDGTFNGTPQPQGVYFWKIDVEFINGSAWKGMTYDKSAPKKTGSIHLIR